MESWQKDLILRNRDRLIQNTVCSALFLNIFLSKEILSAEDVDKIGIEEKSGGKYQAVAKFYDTIVTRINAFKVLLEALNETRQSGAFRILNQRLEDPKPSASSPGNQELLQKKSEETGIEDLIRMNKSLFNDAPAYVKQFIANKQKTTLVIFSEDCQITCYRLMETLDYCKIIYEHQEFVDCVSHQDTSTSKTIVFNCEDNIEECIRLTYGIQRKCVLVTCKLLFENRTEEDEAIIKKLNNSYLTFVKDNITWGDLIVPFRSQLCTQLENDSRITLSRRDISKVLEDADYLTFVELINKKPPTLFKSTVPTPILNYIPRTLLARKVVERQMLTTCLDDVFLFLGITLEELRTVTNIQEVSNSTSVIQQGYKLFTQFIVLDYNNHYARICKNIQHKSFHLLNFDGQDFIWIRTQGRIESIQQCLSTTQPSTTENSFIENLLEDELTRSFPICISDTPGMGKTVFLANVGRTLQEKIQNGLVGYVVISELIRDIKDTMDKLQTEQISEEIVVGVITKYLSANNIGALCLNKNKSHIKELLFDGFDEIDRENENLGYDLLINLRLIYPDTRLWVTTRPHMLLKLEQVLQVLGFNMHPFCENDQISFLTKFWGNCLGTLLYSNKLAAFASHCLVNIKSTLHAKQQDIAGVPLQCLMIAEVFEYEAISFCKSKEDLGAPSLAIDHIIKLYEGLTDKKIKIFFSRYDTSISLGFFEEFLGKILPESLMELFLYSTLSKLAPQDLINVHKFQSVCLLYPNIAIRFRKNLSLRNLSVKQLVDCGLMELKNTEFPTFVHRTIAEYFLANLFFDTLHGNYKKSLRNVIFKEIFQVQETYIRLPKTTLSCFEFKNYVVCYFIDALCATSTSSTELGYELLSNLTVDHKHQIAKACAAGNFQNIFSFLFTKKYNLKNTSDKEFLVDLFCIIVYQGCLPLFDLCKRLGLFSFNLNELWKGDYSLLHFAAFGGDFQIVKQICENENFKSKIIKKRLNKFKDLLPLCFVNTKLLNEQLLEERFQIFKYIININKNLVLCGSFFGKGSFAWKDVHVKFVNEFRQKICENELTSQIFLVDLTKNGNTQMFFDTLDTIFADKQKQELFRLLTSEIENVTLLQTIVQNLKPNNKLFEFLSAFDFRDLSLGILPAAGKANEKKWVDWTWKYSRPSDIDIVASLTYQCVAADTKAALDLIATVDPKIKCKQGNNLLHTLFMQLSATIQTTKFLEPIIKFLLERGVKADSVNENGSTPLHVLAKSGNIAFEYASEYLIDYGASMNAQDTDGNTPLHLYCNTPTRRGFDSIPESFFQFKSFRKRSRHIHGK